MSRMFTAIDVYEAFLAGQEWWRAELKAMGIPTMKPYTWQKLPEMERRKYEIMADHLNRQLEEVQEEQAEVKA